jgi:hypothetical protein
LIVAGHDGVVVRGWRSAAATAASTQVRRPERASWSNWFRENRTFGVLVNEAVEDVTIRGNLFENYKPASRGWHMDYGVATYADTTVTVSNNMYRGSFNQANSSKKVSDLVFTGNLVLIDRGSGVLCGQEPDTSGEERTAGSCRIEGNKFVGNGYYGVRLVNVERAYVRRNEFRGSAGVMQTLHKANLSGSRIRAPWPSYVLFAENRIVGGGRVRLEGAASRATPSGSRPTSAPRSAGGTRWPIGASPTSRPRRPQGRVTWATASSALSRRPDALAYEPGRGSRSGRRAVAAPHPPRRPSPPDAVARGRRR